nr:cyclophilin-like fold protein [Klenkia taihuensis]
MAAALIAGCASSEQTSSATRSTPATSTPSSSPPDTPTTTGSTTQQEGTVQISLTIGSELITATLADTPTAAAFADLLPLTVNVATSTAPRRSPTYLSS